MAGFIYLTGKDKDCLIVKWLIRRIAKLPGINEALGTKFL